MLLYNSNLVIIAACAIIYAFGFIGFLVHRKPADPEVRTFFDQIIDLISNPFIFINTTFMHSILNHYFFTLILGGLVCRVMYCSSRLTMPFTEQLAESTRVQVYEWARRLEIRGLRFGEDLEAVLDFLSKVGFTDEKKGPGELKWQQVYDLKNIDEKYYLLKLIKFLDNDGNEIVDQQIEYLKR